MNTSYRPHKMIPIIVACALFMEIVDTTSLNTSIPIMAVFFGISPLYLKLAITSYIFSLAIFVPISGWIADKYGIRNVFITALIIFTLSSVMCAASTTIWQLIASRILQGMGGAIMLPVGRLILLRSFTKAELVKVTTAVNIPALFGYMIGPLAGGVISTYFSWQWIFLINVPIGILGVILTILYVPKIPAQKVNQFALHEFTFFVLGLSSLSLVISSLRQKLFDNSTLLIFFALSIIFFILYSISYKKSTNRMWNLNIFKIRTFKLTLFGGFFARGSLGGMIFLLPLLFQMGFHDSPIKSGALLLPLAFAMITSKFFTKQLFKAYGFKKVLIVNSLLIAINICTLGLITSSNDLFMIVFLMFFFGIFISIQFSGLQVLIYADLKESSLSQATSIASSMQQIAISIGITLAALILEFMLNQYPINTYSIKAFANTFFIIGILNFVGAITFSFLKPEDGDNASGHQH